MPKKMSTLARRIHPSAAQGAPNDKGNRSAAQADTWRALTDKQTTAPAAWAHVLHVIGERFADFYCQRKLGLPTTFVTQPESTLLPIDVVQRQRYDFTRP